MSSMRTVWNIFKQNLVELVRTPKTLVAVVAIVLLAVLFAWYAVGALWNPYAQVDRLKVAVVNKDAGVNLEEAKAKVTAVGVDANALVKNAGGAAGGNTVVFGTMLEEALAQDDTFDWQFVSDGQARSALASGEYYAEFVIPESFSTEFMEMISSEISRPAVEYWLSDKYGLVLVPTDDATAVSEADSAGGSESGSTDAESEQESSQAAKTMGAGSVDAIVSRGFSSVASQTFSDALKTVATSIAAKGGKSMSGLNTGLDGASQDLDAVEASLNKTKESIDQWRTAVEDAEKALDSLKESAPALRKAIVDGGDELTDARTAAHEVASTYGSTFAQGDESFSGMLSDAASRMESATEPLAEAQKAIDAEISAAEKALAQCEKLIAALVKADPDSSTLADLKAQNEKLQEDIASLKKDSKALSDAVGSASSVASGLSKDAEEAISNLKGRTDTFNRVILPQLDVSLDSLALVMGSLAGTLGSLDAEIAQMKTLLEELKDVLQKTEEATQSSFDRLLAAKNDLSTARSDVAALANAKAVQEASSTAIFSEQAPSSLMSSPISVELQQVFSPGSYGAGVAPLYANLAIWATCIMLLLVFKTKADPLRFLRIRLWQSYLGRLLPLGLVVLLQGVVLTVGYIVMGVQAMSAFALVVSGLVIAFCAVNIVFALDAVFAHVGKAIAVLLVVSQVSLAFGVYPAQLLPEAFQAIGPWMPFTHGISMMGEAIGGFYGLAFVQEMLWLVACGLVTFALAVLVQPRMLTLNRLFARKFEQADLFADEEERLLLDAPGAFFAGGVASRSRLEEELFEDEQFFEDERQQALLLMRARKFAQRYTVVRNAAPLAAIALIAALVVVALMLPLSADDKLVALAVFLGAMAVVAVVCLAFENAYDKMTAQLVAAGVDTSELKNARVVAPTISAPVVAVPEAGDSLVQPLQEEWTIDDGWSRDYLDAWGDDDDALKDAEDAEGAEDSEVLDAEEREDNEVVEPEDAEAEDDVDTDESDDAESAADAMESEPDQVKRTAFVFETLGAADDDADQNETTVIDAVEDASGRDDVDEVANESEEDADA